MDLPISINTTKTNTRKSSPISRENHEYIFLPACKYKEFLKKELSNKNWPEVVKKKINSKDLSVEIENEFGFFQANYTEGGFLKIMTIPDRISVHFIQENIRKKCWQLNQAAQQDKIEINVELLKTDTQKVIIDSVVSVVKLSNWKMNSYKKNKSKMNAKLKTNLSIKTTLKAADVKKVREKAEVVSAGTNLVRTLAEEPTNELNPDGFLQRIRNRVKGKNIKVKLIGKKILEQMGAGAFLAVARASQSKNNGIVHLTWKPSGRVKKKVALLGKGICFDTGGYNTKGPHMRGMHRDMTGAAVSLALLESLVELNYPYEVHCFLAVTENLLAPNGFKSDEVVFAMNGSSIEIVNTDAEGRMVLADTLCYARKFKPDLILDFATLTGLASRSIGNSRGSIFSNSKSLLELGIRAGEISGERVWGFPIGEEYLKYLSSSKADIMQCAPGNYPDHILAATFLHHFAGDDIPWVHVDLSSSSNGGGLGLVSSETTGFGVRWGEALISLFFEKKNS